MGQFEVERTVRRMADQRQMDDQEQATPKKKTADFSKASKRPWHISKLSYDARYIIGFSDGLLLNTIGNTPHEANAALICESVNSYEPMRAENKKMRQIINEMLANETEDFGKSVDKTKVLFEMQAEITRLRGLADTVAGIAEDVIADTNKDTESYLLKKVDKLRTALKESEDK